MKAITLTQPWATLVALGEKKIETRGWACYYPGSLAIHAAKMYPKREYVDTVYREPFYSALRPGGIYRDPLGELACVIAITKVVACCLIGENEYPASPAHSVHIPLFTDRERAFGNFAPGRYAWILGPVLAINPVQARGAQMLWDWDAPAEVIL